MMSTLYQTNTLSCFYQCQFTETTVRGQTCHPTLSPIPCKPVFALSPQCCVLSGEAKNTNFIVWFDPNSRSTTLKDKKHPTLLEAICNQCYSFSYTVVINSFVKTNSCVGSHFPIGSRLKTDKAAILVFCLALKHNIFTSS